MLNVQFNSWDDLKEIDTTIYPDIVVRDEVGIVAIHNGVGWRCDDKKMRRELTIAEFMRICRQKADYIILGNCIAQAYENLLNLVTGEERKSFDLNTDYKFFIFLQENFPSSHYINFHCPFVDKKRES